MWYKLTGKIPAPFYSPYLVLNSLQPENSGMYFKLKSAELVHLVEGNLAQIQIKT